MTRTSFTQQILNVPTSLLDTLDMISLFILTQNYPIGIIIVPILQIRKLRFQKAKLFPQGYVGYQHNQIQHWNPYLFPFKH